MCDARASSVQVGAVNWQRRAPPSYRKPLLLPKKTLSGTFFLDFDFGVVLSLFRTLAA
jgi:hypothetical protein